LKTSPPTVQRPLARAIDRRLRAKNGARRTLGAAARWAVGVEERRGNACAAQSALPMHYLCNHARYNAWKQATVDVAAV